MSTAAPSPPCRPGAAPVRRAGLEVHLTAVPANIQGGCQAHGVLTDQGHGGKGSGQHRHGRRGPPSPPAAVQRGLRGVSLPTRQSEAHLVARECQQRPGESNGRRMPSRLACTPCLPGIKTSASTCSIDAAFLSAVARAASSAAKAPRIHSSSASAALLCSISSWRAA